MNVSYISNVLLKYIYWKNPNQYKDDILVLTDNEITQYKQKHSPLLQFIDFNAKTDCLTHHIAIDTDTDIFHDIEHEILYF